MSPENLHLFNFWQHLLHEASFGSLLYYKPKAQCSCWTEQLLGITSNNSSELLAKTLWINNTSSFLWRNKWNKNLFTIVCLPAEQYVDIIQLLSVLLNYIRDAPVLLEVCNERALLNMDALAARILKFCFEKLMLNVLLSDENFISSRRIYSYQAFPVFKLLTHLYQSTLTLYPNKLLNMHGHAINTFPDQSEPLTILYKNASGALQISGSVWHTLSSFAGNYNASLRLIFEPTVGVYLSYAQMLRFVRNNSVDIAASARTYAGQYGAQPDELSYPLYVGSWCTMMPMWHMLSTHEAMWQVVATPLTWLWIFVGYAISAWLLRWLRFRLFGLIPLLLRLLLMCAIFGQLAAFMIKPLNTNTINSFEKLQQSEFRIAGIRSEFYWFEPALRIKYFSAFLLFDKDKDLMNLRGSFNTSYAYTITLMKWIMYDAEQQHFKRPLFRYAKELCGLNLSFICIILPKNSIYLNFLNLHVLRLQESGLLTHWNTHALYEMVQAGRLHLRDLSIPWMSQPINWQEWLYVLFFYVAGLAISLMVLVFELLVHYTNVFMYQL